MSSVDCEDMGSCHSLEPSEDFIDSHIDSFFPPTEEVIEEDNERKRQSSVKQILVPESMYYDTELGHAVQSEDGAKDLPDDLKEKLDFGSDDDSKGELSSSIRGLAKIEASASVIETLLQKLVVNKTGAEPYKLTDVTEGLMYTDLPDDIVEMTPLMEPRQGEQGSIDKDGGAIDAFTEGAMDAVGAGWDMLVAGANFLMDFVKTAAEYGMKMLGAIAEKLGPIVDAIMDAWNAFVDWIKGEIKQMFSAVIDPLIEGLKGWANGIQDAMTNFFEELAKWNEVNGTESVDATMQAGTALMMSFVGMQDKAEQVTDVLQKVMSFIKPFQKYISPFGAIGVVSTAVSEIAGIEDTPISDAKEFFQKDLASKGLTGLLNLLLDDGGLLDKIGFDDITPDVNFPSISQDALVNFLGAFSDKIGGSFIIDTIVDAVKNVNIGEGLWWVFSGIMYSLSIISLMATTSIPGIILETGSLLSGIASIIIGNVGMIIASITTTWASGFYGLIMSQNPIDKITNIQMINYWEMVLSPFMIFGVVV